MSEKQFVQQKAKNEAQNDENSNSDKGEALATEISETSTESVILPIAEYKGTLQIGDAEIPCFVLSNEKRVLSGRAVMKALGLRGRGQGMDRFLDAKSLQPYMSTRLKDALQSPVQFTVKNGLPQPSGYEAFVLPEICHAVIDADAELEKGLPFQQKKLAIQARILSRAFATVGITALVDEATGYQSVRDKKALHEILSRYISGELLEWTKMFPDDFYKELFRLRGWQYHNMSVKRPVLVGKLTVDLIYKRLAPGVYAKLKEVNPKNEKGRLRQPYTRWLTEEEGKPALDKHIFAVTTIMRGSPNWEAFKRMIDRSLPIQSQNLPLPGVNWSDFNDTDDR
jgi:hypothetical protein